MAAVNPCGFALLPACTIGPFLAIVVSSLHETSPLAGIWLFIAYAVGMGFVVGCAALAVALVRTSLVTRVRRAGPVVLLLAALIERRRLAATSGK